MTSSEGEEEEEEVAVSKNKALSMSPIQCDLTVHSALISDFSASEKMRYLGKSSSDSPSQSSGGTPSNDVDFLQNRITEFCINI